MTLNDSIAQGEARIQREGERIRALQAIRANNFEFDPARADYVTFWLNRTDLPNLPAQAVFAWRVTENAGWEWSLPWKQNEAGSWNQLLAEVCKGTLYPYLIVAGRGTRLMLTD